METDTLALPAFLPDALPRAFYRQDTLVAARALLGQQIVRRWDNGSTSILRIVETEAYLVDDPACHAFRGLTPRTRTMFGPPGYAYVHINYGLHYCLNAVCADMGTAEAVLIRAAESITGVVQLWRNFVGDTVAESVLPPEREAAARADRRIGMGPGRLCKCLAIAREHNDHDLTDHASDLYLAAGAFVEEESVVTCARIGITKGADLPYRFYVRDSRVVSRRVKAKERAAGG